MTDYNDEFWDWVEAHLNDDPTKLRLSKKNKLPWLDDAISHIENRQRSKTKFSSEDPLDQKLIPRLMPIALSTEQATSVSVAKLHRSIAHLPSQAKVLDMTCGLGVDASFLASMPDTRLTAFDLDPKIAAVAQWNFRERSNITVSAGDSVQFLSDTDRHYDLIFIDPARRNSTGGRVYNLHDCAPDVTVLLPLMKSKASRIMIKMSPMLDITQSLRDLPGTSQLWIVEERNECREILAVIDSAKTDNHIETSIMVHCSATGEPFTFSLREENESTARMAMPHDGDYLLEPSPAIMKAAPFKLLCSRYDISMIHSNTHLYTATEPKNGFPGKSYMIEKVMPYSSAVLKKLSRLKLEANVAVRNFPISAEALKTRLGIKKSGDTRIMGITACDGKQYLLQLSPV
ncbi:MAG: class I SAM-dependent methyltransferase [Clostridiales bacterium]|nr:class I SAM-dependent methyltransferase [Clostridiales bacterium]